MSPLMLSAAERRRKGVRTTAQPAGRRSVATTTAHRGKGLTPYQGTRRAYGYFDCDGCGRKWESAYSWADCAQECKRCGDSVYPWRQTRLQQGEEDSTIDMRKPHPQELCGKCQELGEPCWTLDA